LVYQWDGIRRVFQKCKLLYIFENPGFGGEILLALKARKISGEKDSLPLRQEKRRCACPAHPCAHNKNSLVKIKEKMYPNNMISI